jgi:predicted RNA binding protein YcfA (HicA-like mRNA interferase family)
MGIEHLSLLSSELPELFQPKDLSPEWDEGLIIVPVDDPEAIASGSQGESLVAPDHDPESDFSIIEQAIQSIDSPMNPTIDSPFREPPRMPDGIIDSMGGTHAGAPIPPPAGFAPPPDCLAFYLPFHYYYPTWWGIYILAEGVQWLARDIVGRSGGSVEMREATEAARLFLYYHEAFHHKTECFATRLELTHRKPCYKTGFERFFQATWGSDKCLEEGLAEAFALRHTYEKQRNKAIDAALSSHVEDSPPGYRLGVSIRKTWDDTRSEFSEANQTICLPHLPSKNPSIWRTAPHMFDGIANIKARVNYVIPRSSPLAKRIPFRPKLSPAKVVKKLETLVKLFFVRHGGRHDVYRTPSGRNVYIPRHAKDMGTGLLRSILQEAGLNISVDEFMGV